MHQRLCFSAFNEVYRWSSGWKAGTFKRLPPPVVDELLAAVLLLPLSTSNIRRPLATYITATDATPSTGGAAIAASTENVVKQLYRLAEQKGERESDLTGDIIASFLRLQI